MKAIILTNGVLQEMSTINKGLKKVGLKRVNRLLPSRSGDSIRRLINSTHFKLYRANVEKSKQACGFQIATHEISLEEGPTARYGTTLHPPMDVSDDQSWKSQLSPERPIKVADHYELDFCDIQPQSTVNTKVCTSSHQEHPASNTSCRTQIPLFSENSATHSGSAHVCGTIAIGVSECRNMCDSYQNIEKGFSENCSVPSCLPVANLEFGFHSSTPPLIVVENNHVSPCSSEGLAQNFDKNVDDTDLKGGQIEDSSLVSEANGIELEQTEAEESSQPRSILSRKLLEHQKLASINPISVNSTPYRFATSRARAFLAKAGLGPLLRADVATTAESRKESVSNH
jgi:hypothetical protein